MTAKRRFIMLALLAVALGGAVPLRAAGPESALAVPVDAEAKLEPQAAFLAQLLQKGGSVYFRLPQEDLPSRDGKGHWRAEALEAALASQGPLAIAGDVEAARHGLPIKTQSAGREGGGRWLSATGLPKVTLIEDSSTISPLSKGLSTWHWPAKVASYASVESDPRLVLNTLASDLVVFSSPGWWDDFANPPGGPSRMGKKVADALQDYVQQGGTVLFIDIAQWDLEKTWPQTLDLQPLGPYQVSHLSLDGGASGGASLAPVGVATDKVKVRGAFSLLGNPNFAFPDGQSRELMAAYAMPDPAGGQGWVAGLALHVFEQDEALAARLRRLLLNVLLLSGSRRLSTQGEAALPVPTAVATEAAAVLPTPSATAAVTAAAAEPTALPATLVPTALPTVAPTDTETPRPTLVPTAPPTRIPTPWPTPSFTAKPTRAATAVPTRVPTAKPTLKPTPRPVAPALPVPPTPRVAAPLVPIAVPGLPSERPAPTAPPQAVAATPRPALSVQSKSTAAKLAPPPARRPALQPTEAPTQAPRPVVDVGASVKNALGCLDSAPQPFAEGGVYLGFCLRSGARVQVTVFDAHGHTLWRSKVLAYEAGSHKIYFDGRVDGDLIVPGRYLWEVRARYSEGVAESRQASMDRRR